MYITPSASLKCLRFLVSIHYNLTWVNRFYRDITCLPQRDHSGQSLRKVNISLEQKEYDVIIFLVLLLLQPSFIIPLSE